ncbi:MAG: hypothetical protein HC819_07110 [Cyclobacteriaceae bacterium]|nr:hypothetical protein [Cyclobacteriaceae bacterium]
MNNYKEFRPVDFAADVDFIRWIRSPESYPDNTRFWSQWLESNPEKEADVLEAEKLVALFGYPDDVAAHRATLWDRIDTSLEASEATGKQIKMAEKAFNWNALVRYAAVFIIVLTVGAFWYLNKNERPLATMAAKATVYQNINENPKTILLEDGTSVILYQKTRLKIHPEFNVNERKVEVEGKAYFEVLRDEQRPFFVMAQGVTTRVLGTSFW